MMLMTVCGARVGVIATNNNLNETAVRQSARRVTVAEYRGTVYDCNGAPLTNVAEKDITVIFPCEQGAAVLADMTDGKELQNARERLSKGNLVVLDGKFNGESEGAVTLKVPIRYSGNLPHIIGYTDGTSHGVSGIEKGMDEVLFCRDGITVTYSADPYGRMLVGEGYEVSYGSASSVTLTVDSELQRIAERAMSGVTRGAAVVMEAESGKIRAMVSMPWFDQGNVALYLDSSDSPLLNRALCAYNVGSVFKPCVVAAALENGMGNYCYTCVGSIINGGVTFKCNRLAGHGELDLSRAVAESCNTYFYTLSGKLGALNIYNTANNLWFGRPIDLSGGIEAKGGMLPSLLSLQNSSSALINLSIGQGDLLLSPVALANLYAAIVNGGVYRLPTLVEGTQEKGVYTPNSTNPKVRAMDSKTADILKEYLSDTLKDGTGSAAYIEGIPAGGKTGTAQTGWLDGDRKILNGWFCGFVECKNTDYIVVILKEDVKSGSHDCAPVFKEIAHEIFELDKS